jgi:hypothetical protein
MDIVTTLFFYSRYSTSSTTLINKMTNSGLSFGDIKFVCVDKELIRTRIKELNTGISSVPCMTILYKNGNVEKHEGYELFQWVNDFIRMNTPPPPPPPPPPSPRKQRRSKGKKTVVIKPVIEEEDEEEDQDPREEDEYQNTRQDRQVTQLESIPPRRQRVRKDEGNYEDVLMEIEESPPPVIEKAKLSDIKSKADALAREREAISQIRPAGEQVMNRPG